MSLHEKSQLDGSQESTSDLPVKIKEFAEKGAMSLPLTKKTELQNTEGKSELEAFTRCEAQFRTLSSKMDETILLVEAPQPDYDILTVLKCELFSIYNELLELHRDYHGLLQAEEQKKIAVTWIEEKMQWFQFKIMKINEVITSCQPISDRKSVKLLKSHKTKSIKSKSSRSRSSYFYEAEQDFVEIGKKKIELLAEMEFAEQQRYAAEREAERQRYAAEREAELRQMELKKQLVIATAQEKFLRDFSVHGMESKIDNDLISNANFKMNINAKVEPTVKLDKTVVGDDVLNSNVSLPPADDNYYPSVPSFHFSDRSVHSAPFATGSKSFAIDNPKTHAKELKSTHDLNISKNVPVITQPNYTHDINDKNAVSRDAGCSFMPRPNMDRNTVESNNDNVTTMLEMLTKTQLSASLPNEEPNIFDGDIINFPTWLRNFEDLIERKVSLASQRIRYLHKYTKGEAQQCLSGFLGLTTMEDYYKAKDKLVSWFGDSSAITREYKKKLKNWPRIDTKNLAKSVREFALFLETCEELSRAKGTNLNFDDEDLNQLLVMKLPKPSRDKWASKTLQYNERYCSFPPFSEFVKHVVYESKLANLPVVGTGVISKLIDDSKQKSTSHGSNKDSRRYKRSATTNKTEADEKLTFDCVCCKGKHLLQDCDEFIARHYDERIDFIKKNGLCFGCLLHGHRSKDCKKKLNCKRCKRNHPTAIHTEKPIIKAKTTPTTEPSDAATSKSLVTATNKLNQAITKLSDVVRVVPVELFCKDKPSSSVVTYALLDEQSDTTFMLENLRQQLNIDKNEVKLKLSTMTSTNYVISNKLSNLCVRSIQTKKTVDLRRCYTRDKIPGHHSQILTKELAKTHKCLKEIIDEIPDYLPDTKIGLLIGTDCVNAFVPHDFLYDPERKCYGIKTDLGWGIIGLKENSNYSNNSMCNKSVTMETEDMSFSVIKLNQTKEIISPERILRTLEMDFNENEPKCITEYKNEYALRKPLSIEDKRFLDMSTKAIHVTENGHFEMPLPLRNKNMTIENNKEVALKRLNGIKNKFQRDSKFKKMYEEFMHNLFVKGFAEPVPTEELESKDQVWYIPHHGVVNVNKPDRVRVVFDCSAEFKGQSLNKELLTGPDLTNNLFGVLLRFRQQKIAIMADIECMYYQIYVNKEHRDLLRFLWYPNEDYSKEPKEFRMCVHPFGAGSSPGCANLALKTAANMYKDISPEASNFIKHKFYVDDGLISVQDNDSAIKLIKDSKELCKKAGFNLTKFVSNSEEVVNSLPPEDRVKDIQHDFKFDEERVPIQRALGVQWSIQDDNFSFSINLKDQPLTRRGILSTICSIFDPFNFVGPVTLVAKRLLRKICEENKDWDTPVSEEVRSAWERWRLKLPELRKLKIQRCFKPTENIVRTELHHFSDAAVEGYGQCSYLRMISDQGDIFCSFVSGKCRVSPLKSMTIPRLELTAALTSAKVGEILNNELEYDIDENYYWCDSQVVLGYISNESRRFQTFVSNRVHQIRELTEPSQWYHVRGLDNPADDTSRGLCPTVLISPGHRYLHGPEFLKRALPHDLKSSIEFEDQDLPEIRKVKTLKTHAKNKEESKLVCKLKTFSDWYRAKRFIAILTKFKSYLVLKAKGKFDKNKFDKYIDVKTLQRAEYDIIKLVQDKFFPEEVQTLRKSNKDAKECVMKRSPLLKLNPILDDQQILRVGGRLELSELPYELKHPIILPKDNHITDLIIKHYHEKIKHQGRGITLNEIRSNGYWIVHGVSMVNRTIKDCVTCRKLRGKKQVQKMSDLPVDRFYDESPFTYSGMDVFGPFIVKNK